MPHKSRDTYLSCRAVIANKVSNTRVAYAANPNDATRQALDAALALHASFRALQDKLEAAFTQAREEHTRAWKAHNMRKRGITSAEARERSKRATIVRNPNGTIQTRIINS